MNTEEKIATIDWLLPFLELTEKHDCLDGFFHRCDGEWAPVTFMANVNDMFFWGCADGEPVRSVEDVEALRKAIEDCMASNPRKTALGVLESRNWGLVLYACRKRGMRPQGAAYPVREEFWPLIDACGPERAVDMGNPKPHPVPGDKVEDRK